MTGSSPQSNPQSGPQSGPMGMTVRHLDDAMRDAQTVHITGRVIEVIGTLVKAHVPNVRIGEICHMRDADGTLLSQAEVIGFAGDAALLILYGPMNGLSVQTDVIPTGRLQEIPVGDALLGRVIDSTGAPLDADTRGPLITRQGYPVYQDAPDPLKRQIISRPMPLGVRALDGLLTCGEGQRIGIFAAAGVGKSTLLASLVLGTQADVTILALIGERGREVREFIEHTLGPEGMKQTVVVVATSDKSPMERARAAWAATAIAEYFRDRGRRVMLLMDSVTRFARALREIGLAAGEPPTRRGFPPSVFAALPRLMERTGMGASGSITAFYTVLVEGDDMSEPVADETRSILDGHVILSRDLAAANHYPAISVLDSASRVMNNVISGRHAETASRLRSLLAAHADVELLLRIGEYKSGQDALTDEAVEKISRIREFLRQSPREPVGFDDTLAAMEAIAA